MCTESANFSSDATVFIIFVYVHLLLDGDIDFLTHYKLVDPGKIESYARAFVVEDDDFDTVITATVGDESQSDRYK